MTKNEGFRNYLQKEFIKRAKKNPRYSIRSFAKFLALEPSSLAQILAGKRNLTDKMCSRIAIRLKVTPVKFRMLTKTVSSEQKAFQSFSLLSEDAFIVISDWHYYAILELTRTSEFKSNLNWIARVLGLTLVEVQASVQRLQRLGYLKVDSSGNFKDEMGSAINTGNVSSAPAMREHQKQLLKKATEALDEIAYEERVQSSMMFVGSKRRVAEAKARILNFIEEIDEFMKSDVHKDEVYSLTVSMFPVSNISKTKTKEVSCEKADLSVE